MGVSSGGIIHLRSQIEDYRHRGEELENYSFLEYVVDTYEERTSSHGEGQNTGTNVTRLGWRKNTRVPYQPEHPRANTTHRVVRTIGHCNLPDNIGPWFERNDNTATYPLHCTSVLACLKLWRNHEDLKVEDTPWSTAPETFLANTNNKHRSICANTQYYYQCRESADRERDVFVPEDSEGNAVTDFELAELVNGVDVDKLFMSSRKELDYAEEAATVGHALGCFGDSNGTVVTFLLPTMRIMETLAISRPRIQIPPPTSNNDLPGRCRC